VQGIQGESVMMESENEEDKEKKKQQIEQDKQRAKEIADKTGEVI